MKNQLFYSFLLISFTIFSCEYSLIGDDDCIDCPRPTRDFPPPQEPDPDPETDPDPDPAPYPGMSEDEIAAYNHGCSIGTLDAQYIAETTFYEGECVNNNYLQDLIDDLNNNLIDHTGIQIDSNNYTYDPGGTCYYTTASQKSAFYEFVSDYFNLTGILIEENKGTVKEYYWLGVWECFSKKNCELAFTYSYAAGCDFNYY